MNQPCPMDQRACIVYLMTETVAEKRAATKPIVARAISRRRNGFVYS
jgi:hypothetical protein